MTDTDFLRHYCQSVGDVQDFFREWLFRDALPLWYTAGADQSFGGFYERLNLDGSPHNIDRRTRVAARQVYSYATAQKMGYRGSADDAIAHGLAWLAGPARTGVNGTVSSIVGPDGRAVRPDFDLYDHAFVLLAYASAWSASQEPRLRDAAIGIRDRIIDRYAHPVAGFWDNDAREAPLKANPHMHLLEACLAWIEAGGDPDWRNLAAGIVELCFERFIDQQSGALREFFNADWLPVTGDAGRILEPGHQFEWAWLLLRWSRHSGDDRCLAAAERLVDIGETYGVDPVRNVALNEIWDDFSAKDASARLWPQTERVKAHCALLPIRTDARLRRDSIKKLLKALDGMRQYLTGGVPGLYRDRMLADGSFVEESAPASTLYHIVCAIEELCSVDYEDRSGSSVIRSAL